ncbi:allergen Tha p 1-like isoform X1 [Leptidea sinapis]|uniref:allergen Tha p 1-like isoform X1 n=1 Tax=Leptidea sinapis TaxID=189913 RepID=UPI0021376074|nr:allergen Tha p 1-like isoform X1 [Leptidea sinapis]
MKRMRSVYFLVACVFVFVNARPETYTDKFDGIDLNEVLSNRRLLVPYVHCALEKGKCSPEAKELKSHIKEALENYCAKCTEKQKQGTRTVIRHLIKNESDFWQELVNKYDPAKKYVSKYENELKTITV